MDLYRSKNFDLTHTPDLWVRLKSDIEIVQISLLSPAFSKKSGGTKFFTLCLSILPSFHPSFRSPFHPPIEVGTLWAQLLLQFYTDSFETSLVFWSWSVAMHVVRI